MEKENKNISNFTFSQVFKKQMFILTHEFNPQVVCYTEVSM